MDLIALLADKTRRDVWSELIRDIGGPPKLTFCLCLPTNLACLPSTNIVLQVLNTNAKFQFSLHHHILLPFTTIVHNVQQLRIRHSGPLQIPMFAWNS